MHRLLHPLLLVASLGCTRHTWLDTPTRASADAEATTTEAEEPPQATIDTGDPPSGDTGRDTGGGTAADTDTDTAKDTGPAPDPPPQVCLPKETDGFRMPSTRWALSVLMASRRLSEPDGNRMQVSPTWLLASAWQTDTFSCGGYGTPWSDNASEVGGGCFQLQGTTHWYELVRLFPDQFQSDGWPAWVDGDSPERSSLALVQALYAGHLLLRRATESDPDTWLTQSTDPLAASRIAAFFHFEGPWSATASRALTSCNDNLLDCADSSLLHHVEGIEAKQVLLAAAECYDDPIPDSDLDAFLEGIRPIWPHVDWTEARNRALDARTGAGFAIDGLAIVEALEAAVDARLSCPAETLWDHYRYSCY